MPSLYLVSTPIGNLGDLSHRAVEVLGAVDVILAEDTRRTGLLLRHFGIEGRLISAHEHNESARARLVAELLGEGKDVAVVSDAGTPLLSDPGARLVRSAIDAGFDVVPIPGASALLAALVASGLSAERFAFYGFLPRKGGPRQALIREIATSRLTGVVYEAPQRVKRLLEDLHAVAGDDRPVVLARELTKLHEEVYRATLQEALSRLSEVEPRGEYVVLLAGAPAEDEDAAAEALDEARRLAAALLAQGVPPSAAARELRERLDMARNDAYQLVQQLAEEGRR